MTTDTPSLDRAGRSGGTDGNELLTIGAAAVLIPLLVAVGVTILDMGGLRIEHMFIGFLLVPPVALKLASTGYRFVRYYTGSPTYTAKGPPLLALRLLAPALVVTTVVVFASGIILLVDGHKASTMLEIHKVSFIVWGVVFALHFLAYVPRVARSLVAAAQATRGTAVPGGRLRDVLLGCAIGGGVAIAVSLLPAIESWRP